MTTVGIVTGAGRGIGLACAARATDLVDVLVLADVNQANVVSASQELMGRGKADVVPFPLDVTDVAGLERLANQSAELGELRAVVSAAGISVAHGDWRRVLDVDLVACARLQEVLGRQATSSAVFVQFASVIPWIGIGDHDPAVDAVIDDPLADDFYERLRDVLPGIKDAGLAYSWAKRGIVRLVRREAVRLGPVGARVCSVSPGTIDTPMVADEEARGTSVEPIIQRTPLRRKGQAAEVAAVVAFLLSEEASFVNGTDVLVDGGLCASFAGQATFMSAE